MSKTLKCDFKLTKIVNNCTSIPLRYYVITLSALFAYYRLDKMYIDVLGVHLYKLVFNMLDPCFLKQNMA